MLQRTEDGLLVDVEECGDDAVEGAWQSHRRLQKTIDKLQQARTKDGMFKCVVDDIHACTGYDRVLIYKFHPDCHGEVVAECKGPLLKESWLGLHYPATDIPQRSRDLFKANCVRLIYDVSSKPSELVSESPARAPESISLASSTLRAVHPCHLEYLQNMGVKASLVLSVVLRGSLWGLIVCHHYANPRFVPFQTRTACEFLLQAFSIRMASVLESDLRMRQDRKNHVHASLSENMARGTDHDSILYGIFCTDANICHLIPDTCGAAVFFAGKIMQFGEVPDDETIRKIVRWRQGQAGDQPLAVSNLAREIPGFDNIGCGVAGALCAPLVDQGMLVWFRPEFAHTIRWAGDPALNVSAVPGRTMLPRSSFEAFTQSVVGQCAAWTGENLQDAEALVRLVDEVLVSSDQDLRSTFLDQFRARLLQDRAACKLVAAELSRLIHQAGVPVFAADTDGMVVEWNERCAALSGVPHDAAVGRRLGELQACHGPLPDALAACTGHEMRNFPVRMGPHDLLFVAPARRIAGGRVVGAVFIGQEAPEAARMLGGWGDAGRRPPIEDGTAFSVSRDGKVETWSAAVAAMTQIGASAVRDRLLAGQVFGGVLPLLDSTAAVRLEVTIAGALAGTRPGPLELLFSRADGSVVQVLIVPCQRLSPHVGGGLSFLAYDITGRRVLELASFVCSSAIAITTAQTDQLGLLCRGIRRSLSAVLATTSLLVMGSLCGRENAALLHATKRCGTHLLAIANNLLDLRGLVAGKKTHLPCDFSDLIRLTI
jgi:PAS domain-containing protein